METTNIPMSSGDAQRILNVARLARLAHATKVADEAEELIAERCSAEVLGRHYIQVAKDLAGRGERDQVNAMLERADIQMTFCPTGRIEVLTATGFAAWQLGKPVQALRALIGADKLIQKLPDVDPDIVSEHSRVMRCVRLDTKDYFAVFTKALQGLPQDFA